MIFLNIVYIVKYFYNIVNFIFTYTTLQYLCIKWCFCLVYITGQSAGYYFKTQNLCSGIFYCFETVFFRYWVARKCYVLESKAFQFQFFNIQTIHSQSKTIENSIPLPIYKIAMYLPFSHQHISYHNTTPSKLIYRYQFKVPKKSIPSLFTY